MDHLAWDTPKSVVLAGFFGGIMSLSFVDGMGPKQRAVAVVSGMIMAYYVAPLIASLFKEDTHQETIGFLVGLFGMSICAAVFRAIQNSNLWLLIMRRFGKGPDTP